MQTTAKAIGTLFPNFNTATTVRKPFDVLTMIEGANSFTGTDAQGDHYDALKVYWRFVPAQEAAVWDGEGQPPAGFECEVIEGELVTWEEGEKHLIGKRVLVHASFFNGCDQPMTAFEIPSTNKCYVILSRLLRPIKTPEQIEAEEREQDAQALFELINPEGKWHKFDNHGKDRYRAAVAAGYRKQVAP